MKRIRCVFLLYVCVILLNGCIVQDGAAATPSFVETKEQPHLYWKTIDVTVTNIDKRHWYASTHWYRVNIDVNSEEYGLSKSFEISGSGAFGCPKEYNYEVGDVVQAELYSWKIDSTGEIVKREIHSLK